MKHTTGRLGAALLATFALSSTALAQAPSVFPTPNGPSIAAPFPAMPPGRTGPLEGPPFPQGRNMGGFGSRMVFGVVKSVNAAANTLAITPSMGGEALTVKVGANAQIVRETTVTASDLRANDQVQVSGIPTQVTASQIVAGQLPTGFPGAGRGGLGGGQWAGGPNSGAGGANDGPTGQATATVNARVLQTSPLLLSLGNGVTISVKLDPRAKISRIATVALGTVQAGDQVFALGQSGDDGTLTATSLGVNLSPGGGGFAGPRTGLGGVPGRQSGPVRIPPMTMPPTQAMPDTALPPGGGSVGTQIVPNGE